MWTISVRDRHGRQIAWWRSEGLPDVWAIKAMFPFPVTVIQYRFLS